jgi:formylglycine-generating enzyme required for sulfatase activity
LVVALTLLAAATLPAAEGISNVRISQRAGTNLVDLRYDLSTTATNPLLVAVAVSTNAGNTYDLPATHFTGAVGYGVTAGTNQLIVWDAVRDMPDRFSTNVFFRLSASDVPAGMVLIPAGSFVMGDTLDGISAALPLHTNQLSAFYMDKFDVTKALWDEVRTWALTNGYSFDNAGSGKATNHPVHTVNWWDCVKWCNARSEKAGLVPAYYTSAAQTTVYRTGQVGVQNDWVKWSSGYRLTTEAEWEKAARGGVSGQRFPWGNTITHSNANYYSDSSYTYDTSPTRGYHPNFQAGGYPYTNPVDYFPPNGYGLYDMAGNVYQWCWDWYGSYTAAPATDPRGPSGVLSYRVLRGGYWDYYAYGARCANRSHYNPGVASGYFGFRCVRGL